jgi:Flp pilus assembly pilin Flp
MWQLLWRDERGQDIVEYTLLMAALVLFCGGMVIAVGTQTNVIWSIVNSRLAAANSNGS